MAAHVDDEQAVADSETGANRPRGLMQRSHGSEVYTCIVNRDDLRPCDGGNADCVHTRLGNRVGKTGGGIGPALNASERCV